MTDTTPILDYESQTKTAVTVTYANLPAGCQLLFVNKMSGERHKPSFFPQGDGKLILDFRPEMRSGEYYMRCEDGATHEFLAQTVSFFVSRE